MTSFPPPYDSSRFAPSYSSLPLADEETIGYTPRLGAPHAPTGIYTRQWRQLTMLLKEQDEVNRLPVYDRNSCVHGELDLATAVDVVSVTLKVHDRCSERPHHHLTLSRQA